MRSIVCGRMGENLEGAHSELVWRVVPVAALPFPHHLFRCPFEDRHRSAVAAVGAPPDDFATPDQRRRAFKLFLGSVKEIAVSVPPAGLVSCGGVGCGSGGIWGGGGGRVRGGRGVLAR
jgi:hypothetical protein